MVSLQAQNHKDSLNSKKGEAYKQVQNLLTEVSKVIVGPKEMLEGIVIGLLTGGHVLLEGVPGLAKTLALSSVAKALSLNFQRIQFTPDLLPTDLIGTMVFNPKSGNSTLKKDLSLPMWCWPMRSIGPC